MSVYSNKTILNLNKAFLGFTYFYIEYIYVNQFTSRPTKSECILQYYIIFFLNTT